jgi:CBS domain-containing membrane protein
VTSRSKPFRLFHPILAGATLKDRLIAALGALACLSVIALVCTRTPLPLAGLVAPVGASAVLLFAVPASPLAQPWSILGGNVVSGVIGVAVVQALGPSAWAAGAAVAGAILAMSLLRCLHPPGGAVALTAVIGGPAILQAGLAFPLGVVAIDSVALVILGWLFHRVSGHSYPHRARPAVSAGAPHHLHRSDISQALADVGEAFDVSAEDLEVLLERAEHYALLRNPPIEKPTASRRRA